MQKFKKPFGIITAIIMSLALIVGAAACNPGTTPEEMEAIKVEVSAPKDTISSGESLQMTATVTGTENQTCLWSVSDPLVLKVSETGLVTILKAPEIIDINVTVTATSAESSKARGTKTIRVLAPSQDGQVGLLTSDKIKAINGDNITLSGTVTDIFMDTHTSDDSYENLYDVTVKIVPDRWYGKWNAHNSSIVMEDLYYKGERDDVPYTELSSDGTQKLKVGHSVETQYVTRKNQVATKVIKDYKSDLIAWEARHYNNHLKSFQNLIKPTRVKYDPANDKRYSISLNIDSFEEAMLAAYLAQSFTPMLDPENEWFETVVFVLTDDGKAIKGIEAETQKIYTGAETDKQGNITSYDTVSYSVVKLDISDVGTTFMSSISSYLAPKNADKLTAALQNIRSATSYKFSTVVNQTFAVTPDDGDYSLESYEPTTAPLLKAARAGEPTARFNNDPYDYLSATGSVGQTGWITPETVVLATTSMYTATSDGKPYRTEYTGYRQFDGYYEHFDYYSKKVDDVTTKGLIGDRRYSGMLTDQLPKFDFSADIFNFVGETLGKNGKVLYTFTLLPANITREIAMQVNMYSYASSGTADSRNQLTIVVNEDGKLVSVEYPYNINDNYSGTVKTTYSDVNSTAVNAEKITTNYIERGTMDKWSDYTIGGYYRVEYGKDKYLYDYNAEAAAQSIYGSSSKLPSPTIFQEVFGDSIFVHYNDDVVTDDDGSTRLINRRLDITVTTDDVDENTHLNDYMAIYTPLTQKLVAAGFALDQERTDITGGETGNRDRIAIYVSGDITVRVESNGTKTFWIDFYNNADYNK